MAPHYINQGQSILERWITPLALLVIVGIGSWNAWTTIVLLKSNGANGGGSGSSGSSGSGGSGICIVTWWA